MSPWVLTYEEYVPEKERRREALCALGNGYMAMRGSAAESSASEHHYPGTYLAGYFDRLTSQVGDRELEHESMVNMPNPLVVRWRPQGGEWFDLDTGDYEILDYVQELDMKRGLLLRRMRVRDADGRTTRVAERRMVHMGHRHLAAQEITFVAEDWSGPLEVHTAIDGTVQNTGVDRYRALRGDHLEPAEQGEDEQAVLWLAAQTKQSRLRVAEAVRTRVHSDGKRIAPDLTFSSTPGYVAHDFVLELTLGESLTVERAIAVFGSRDKAISEPLYEARKHAARARSFDRLLDYHALMWDQLWRRFGIRIESTEGPRVQRTLNLHILHLLQAVSPNTIDIDAGVPARGLHGEAYRGHIFWDELFIFPSVNFRLPDLTRALLQYRHRRLNEARRSGYDHGLRGALYPWQSGSNGQEESQTLHLNPRSGEWTADNSSLQRHIDSAIAYNIWSYYQTTGDLDFMTYYGTEMLVEIARFWATAAVYDRSLDRYEILGVMGPDEYHDAYPGASTPGLDNNAYTNVMAAWSILRAVDAVYALEPSRRRELLELLTLEPEELERWDDVSRKLKVPFHDGVISQFEGYENLEELDWAGYAEKYGDIRRLDRILAAEGDTTNRYKASKQADVLMLFYLLSTEQLEEMFSRLGYDWSPELVSRNIEYYMARTAHGSTLSRIVHSWVNVRLDRERSWRYFSDALESDISDLQDGTTSEGIHLGAMAGTVDLVQRCYTGIEPRADMLLFDPALPSEITELEMDLRYRGVWLHVRIGHERMVLTSHPCAAGICSVGIGDKRYDFEPGAVLDVALQDSPIG